MKVYFPLFILFVFVLTISGCKDYPKDPMNTLQKVKGDTLKVAFSGNELWIEEDNNKIIGIEAEMIKAFAQSIHAEVEWINGSESELMPMVKRGEYHIFIGGLTKKSPWKKHVGFTNPYMRAKIFVGVSPDVPLPENIDGKKVAVKKGSSLGIYVEKENGIPEYVNILSGHTYIAAYEWEILNLGYTKTDIKLHEEKQVIAVPQGENAFLMELEKFINQYVK